MSLVDDEKKRSQALCKDLRSSLRAGGGGRTRTVSLPTDFESVTSANSITPAYRIPIYYSISVRKCQDSLANIRADGGESLPAALTLPMIRGIMIADTYHRPGRRRAYRCRDVSYDKLEVCL